jgi:nitrogen regulatory protein PII 2
MKEVMAIIRMNQIAKTKQALVDAGFPSMTAAVVSGRGRQTVDFELCQVINEHPEDSADMLPLLTQGPHLIAKRLISLVVPDERVKEAVDTLIAANQTGNPGDGKIFVMPIYDSVRVSNGESGAMSIADMILS